MIFGTPPFGGGGTSAGAAADEGEAGEADTADAEDVTAGGNNKGSALEGGADEEAAGRAEADADGPGIGAAGADADGAAGAADEAADAGADALGNAEEGEGPGCCADAREARAKHPAISTTGTAVPRPDTNMRSRSCFIRKIASWHTLNTHR